MKAFFSLILFLTTCILTVAQDPHLEVEGDAKILGRIDIHHPLDSTTLLIGHDAGLDMSFDDAPLNNTFVGYEAGVQNTTGESNSFYGVASGFYTTTGKENSSFGVAAGAYNVDGNHNTYLGFQAGLTAIGSRNTFIGSGSDPTEAFTELDNAIAIGYETRVGCSNCAVIGGVGQNAIRLGLGTDVPQMTLDVRGDTQVRGRLDINHPDDTTSVFVGRNAGSKMTFQFTHQNTIVGANAGSSNVSASDNSFFGSLAGAHSTAEGNSFFGSNAGFNNTNGYENSFFGYQSGEDNQGGSRNSFYGFQSGRNYNSGSGNTFIGSGSGNNGEGSGNTFIGTGSGHENTAVVINNAVALGRNARVGCSNCAVIGGTESNAVKVGIGVAEPQQVLDVNGNAAFRDVPVMSDFTSGTAQLFIEISSGRLLRSAVISDARQDANIITIDGVMQRIKELNHPIKQIQKGMQNYNSQEILEEAMRVFPELILTQEDTQKQDYKNLSLVLLQAIMEQELRYEELQKEVHEIQNQLLHLVNQFSK